jgi:hypothetical protein
MTGLEGVIVAAAAKGAAGAFGKAGTERAIRTFKTSPLKWSIGVMGGVKMALPDTPESEVSVFLATLSGSLPPGKGLHPRSAATVSGGDFDVELLTDTYGSMDELEDDELTMLFNDLSSSEPRYSSSADDTTGDFVQPTVSSLTVYLYPQSLPKVSDIERFYSIMQRIESTLSKGIVNQGTFRWLFLVVDPSKVADIRRTLHLWAQKSGASVEAYSDAAGHEGVLLTNPTDLQAHQLVRILFRNLGGISNRILRRSPP